MLEKRLLTGGLDFDSDDRLVQNGDYRYALNILSSKNDYGNQGAITNVKGTTEIEFDLPIGDNRVIGSFEVKQTLNLYYWVWNSNSNHQLLEYNAKDRAITKVLSGQVLNLQLDYKITHADWVDGLLFWTDGFNHPRYVNVERAKSGNYPSPLKESHINNIVPQPVLPPLIEYDSDPLYKFNNLKGNMFQFRSQFENEDNMRSAWSTISKISYPKFQNIYDVIQAVPETYLENVILLTLETGDSTLRKIRIAVRSGNFSDFYLLDVIDKDDPSTWVDGIQPQDNSTYIYKFYNDKSLIPINAAEQQKLYDFIPLKANAQCLLDGQRIGYFGVTEGFDNVRLNVFPFVFKEEVQRLVGISGAINGIGKKINGVDQVVNGANDTFTSDIVKETLLVNSSTSFANYLSGANNLKTEFYINGFWNEGDIVKITYSLKVRYAINNNQNVIYKEEEKIKTITYNVTSADAANISVLNSSLISEINASLSSLSSFAIQGIFSGLGIVATPIPPQFGIGTQIDASFVTSVTSPPPTAVESVFANVSVFRSNVLNVPTQTYKSGSSHQLGIVYYDYAGRFGKVNSDSSTNVYVPFDTEDDTIGVSSIRLAIGHNPPDWATHYQIVYAGNSLTNRFIRARVGNVVPTTNNRWKISLKPIFKYNEGYNNVTNLSYSYSKGDRIRGVWKTTQAGAIDVFNDFIEYEVIGFDESTFEITVSADSTNIMQIGVGNMVEIYSPKKDIEERLFFETGDVFKIENGFHRGNVQNQTASNAAIVDVNSGDVWFRARKYNYTVGYSFASNDIFVEDFSFSDFFDSNFWNRGRPNNVDPTFRRIYRPTTAYYTESYIPETQVNGLSNVFAESFKTYPIQYGDIVKAYSRGDNVLVGQRLRVGQILVNKEVLFDSSGQQAGVVGKAQQVLSQISYYSGEYGITHPESFAVYGNSVYFVDANRASVIRLGGDGMTRISSSEGAMEDRYKMNSYFTPKFEARNKNKSPYFVRGVYNKDNEEFILSYLDIELYAESIVIDSNDNVVDRRKLSRLNPSIDFQFTPPLSNGEFIFRDSVETISFSEAKNRWVTFYSFVPDWMNESDTGYVLFKNGRLYVANDSDIRNNFFGTQFTSKVTTLFNQDPTSIKFFLNQLQESTDVWSNTSITNQFGQESSLIEGDFDEFEGVYKAFYLRDANTPNVDLPLIEGDTLRCHSLVCELENYNTEEVKLFAVSSRYSLSELNN